MSTTTSTSSRTRLFTLEEANRMLPLVRRIVEDIVSANHSLCERESRLRNYQSAAAARVHWEEVEAIEESMDMNRSELAGYINELTDLGVILKSIQVGGVSFPAVFRGRLVFLSWQLGEASVGHWQELDAGFAGRQPIASILPDLVNYSYWPS
jgi:hypothetical protein